MTRITDKRSSATLVTADLPPDETPKPERADVRADGSLRRGPAGVRTLADFFDPKHQREPLRRGELLGFLSSLEYARQQRRWYRRLWRALRGLPQVTDTVGAMVTHHAQLIERTTAAVAAELASKEARRDG
jgi:hypothetical protein